MSNVFVMIKMCYVHNQCYDISCATLYACVLVYAHTHTHTHTHARPAYILIWESSVGQIKLNILLMATRENFFIRLIVGTLQDG